MKRTILICLALLLTFVGLTACAETDINVDLVEYVGECGGTYLGTLDFAPTLSAAFGMEKWFKGFTLMRFDAYDLLMYHPDTDTDGMYAWRTDNAAAFVIKVRNVFPDAFYICLKDEGEGKWNTLMFSETLENANGENTFSDAEAFDKALCEWCR